MTSLAYVPVSGFNKTKQNTGTNQKGGVSRERRDKKKKRRCCYSYIFWSQAPHTEDSGCFTVGRRLSDF